MGGIDGADMPDFDASQLPDGSDVDGLTVFSIRGIVAMLCVGGWSGIALLDTALPPVVAVILAVLLGVAALIGMAYLMRAVYKLQSSGNIDVENCIGKIGEVYIPIPAAGNGSGKVNLTVQEKFSEFSAITTSDDQLKTGAFVRVVAVGPSGVLVVEPLDAQN